MSAGYDLAAGSAEPIGRAHEELRERREESAGLYVGWEELRRRIAPRLGRERFRALIKEKTTRAGFPPIREEWGGWYWPKVRQWLDLDNEVAADERHRGFIPTAQDGPENFDAPPRTRPRPETRQAQPAVLDRKADRARPSRVSGHLRPVAGGRD